MTSATIKNHLLLLFCSRLRLWRLHTVFRHRYSFIIHGIAAFSFFFRSCLFSIWQKPILYCGNKQTSRATGVWSQIECLCLTSCVGISGTFWPCVWQLFTNSESSWFTVEEEKRTDIFPFVGAEKYIKWSGDKRRDYLFTARVKTKWKVSNNVAFSCIVVAVFIHFVIAVVDSFICFCFFFFISSFTLHVPLCVRQVCFVSVFFPLFVYLFIKIFSMNMNGGRFSVRCVTVWWMFGWCVRMVFEIHEYSHRERFFICQPEPVDRRRDYLAWETQQPTTKRTMKPKKL